MKNLLLLGMAFISVFVIESTHAAIEWRKVPKLICLGMMQVSSLTLLANPSQARSSSSDHGCYAYRLENCEIPFSAQMNPVTGELSGLNQDFSSCTLKCDLGSSCFSGDDSVEISEEDGSLKTIQIKDLRVGDLVVSGQNSDGSPILEKVVDFFHREPEIQGRFISIQLKGIENPLFISAKHLIKRTENPNVPYDDSGWVFAEEVRTGDWVYYKGSSVPVEKIEPGIVKEGLYAPLTDTCTIQVNGISCSCLAEINSQHLGKLYTKARHLVVSPLKREECTHTHSHPVSTFDSWCYRIVKFFPLGLR